MILRQQPFTRRIDEEIARFLAACGFILHIRQQSRFLIDRVGCDRFVSPITDIQKLAARMHQTFSSALPSFKSSRDCGDLLNRMQAAVFGIAVESCHDHRHLIVCVSELAGRMNGKVTRASTGGHECCGLLRRRQHVLFGVKVVDHDAVNPQVRGIDESVVAADVDRMCVRPFLATFVNTAAFMLNVTGNWFQ